MAIPPPETFGWVLCVMPRPIKLYGPRNRTRTNKDLHSWVLTSTPIHVTLKYFAERHQLGLSVRYAAKVESARCNVRVRLSQAESHEFFRRLGEVLDYEMPRSQPHSSSGTYISILKRTKKGRRYQRRTGEIVMRTVFSPLKIGTPGPSGRIVIRLSRRKAHDLFKSLAEPLGWELYEKEMAA